MIIGKLKLIEYIEAGEKERPDANAPHIKIITCDGAAPFDKTTQVGRDSIDLRLGNYGYRIKRDYEYISTLDEDINNLFDSFEFSTEQGLIIDPGETVVIAGAERIKLSGPFFGEVMGRSRYARMGISVHCTAPKFQGYSDAIVAFQLTNNNLVPVKVFPYQTIAQLVIHEIKGYPPDVEGKYYDESELMRPYIDDKELSRYNDHDKARIKKNKSRKSELKKTTGKIDRLFGIQRSLMWVIIALDALILGIAVFGCFVPENGFMRGIITALLSVISGALSFINKRVKE